MYESDDFNGSGECSTTLNLCVRAQTAPSSFSYPLPAVSEFSCPPHSTGLLLLGDSVLMKPGCDQAGLPAGSFSVKPALPSGLTLNVQTGDIQGAPSSKSERKAYTVTLANPSGRTDFVLSLEVQQQRMPGPFKYDDVFGVTERCTLSFKLEAASFPSCPPTSRSKPI